MSADSKPSVHRLLTDYAESRRSQGGVPFEMPPATRAAVQREVSARWGGEGAGTRQGPAAWLGWWHRIAWIGAGAAATAVGCLLWLQSRPRTGDAITLAQAPEKAPTAASRGEAGSVPAALPAGTQTAVVSAAPVLATTSAGPEGVAPAPVAEMQPQSTDADRSLSPPGLSRYGLAPATAEKGMRSRPMPQLGGGATRRAVAPARLEDVGQRFVQAGQQAPVRVEQGPASLRSVVLNEFQIQPLPDRLRVVDGDGSFYDGPRPRQATRPVERGVQFAVDAFGTNRSLQQPVRLQANLIITNALPQSGSAEPTSGSAPDWLQSVLSNSVLRGQFQVGSDRPVELNAVPMSR